MCAAMLIDGAGSISANCRPGASEGMPSGGKSSAANTLTATAGEV